MRGLLIAIALLSACSYERFEVKRAEVDRSVDVAMALSAMGWDIAVSNNRQVATEWHRMRLYHSPLYVTEVQIKIAADFKRGTVVSMCTQRVIRKDGVGAAWWFSECTDSRALRIIEAAMQVCQKEE